MRTLSSSSLVHLSRLMFGFTRWRHRCAHCCPVRPGRNPATVDHLFPYFSCMRWSRASSSFVHGTWWCFGGLAARVGVVVKTASSAAASTTTRDADAHVISKCDFLLNTKKRALSLGCCWCCWRPPPEEDRDENTTTTTPRRKNTTNKQPPPKAAARVCQSRKQLTERRKKMYRGENVTLFFLSVKQKKK